uniref:Uncharacterized protein n=1 Tax=Romanomermis culicivorax TaxID=13658 RepID=A0A915IQC8_ROMCU
MAKEYTTPEILTSQRSKTETSKSQTRMETSKGQTKSDGQQHPVPCTLRCKWCQKLAESLQSVHLFGLAKVKPDGVKREAPGDDRAQADKYQRMAAKSPVPFYVRGMLGTLLMASPVGKWPCKSSKFDDQRRKHLYRNGAPQKDEKIGQLDESEGPLAQVGERDCCVILEAKQRN